MQYEILLQFKFCALITIFELTFVESHKWAKDQFPNPFSSPAPFCNLEDQGHPFCDPDRLLEETQIKHITEKQREISQLGKCPCSGPCKEGESGLVIGLVIVKEVENSNGKLDSNDANPDVLQEFSDHIRKKWDLGACDNSILITIAEVPKQYGLSIGENANKIINKTWHTAILQESFRERKPFNIYAKIKDILYMYKEAVNEELKKSETGLDGSVASLTDSNNSSTLYTALIICLVVVIIVILTLIALIFFRHRKENDDVSLKDVWTKKFWLKAGNQYKEAKQSEIVNEKDIEKNEDEEVKAKLASTEDLKPVDDIENVDEDKIQYPKFSKV